MINVTRRAVLAGGGVAFATASHAAIVGVFIGTNGNRGVQPSPPLGNFIDDNGVTSWIDNLGVTSFTDDLGH